MPVDRLVDRLVSIAWSEPQLLGHNALLDEEPTNITGPTSAFGA